MVVSDVVAIVGAIFVSYFLALVKVNISRGSVNKEKRKETQTNVIGESLRSNLHG